MRLFSKKYKKEKIGKGEYAITVPAGAEINKEISFFGSHKSICGKLTIGKDAKVNKNIYVENFQGHFVAEEGANISNITLEKSSSNNSTLSFDKNVSIDNIKIDYLESLHTQEGFKADGNIDVNICENLKIGKNAKVKNIKGSFFGLIVVGEKSQIEEINTKKVCENLKIGKNAKVKNIKGGFNLIVVGEKSQIEEINNTERACKNLKIGDNAKVKNIKGRFGLIVVGENSQIEGINTSDSSRYNLIAKKGASIGNYFDYSKNVKNAFISLENFDKYDKENSDNLDNIRLDDDHDCFVIIENGDKILQSTSNLEWFVKSHKQRGLCKTFEDGTILIFPSKNRYSYLLNDEEDFEKYKNKMGVTEFLKQLKENIGENSCYKTINEYFNSSQTIDDICQKNKILVCEEEIRRLEIIVAREEKSYKSYKGTSERLKDEEQNLKRLIASSKKALAQTDDKTTEQQVPVFENKNSIRNKGEQTL